MCRLLLGYKEITENPVIELRNFKMFSDKKSTWVAEYIIGLSLLVVISPAILRPNTNWSMAYSWAYLLFVACSGIILVSAAGSMRQRMKLEERINKLERMLQDRNIQNQQQSEPEQKQKTAEQLISSVN